ncbi:MAG: FKBP-type peptidyl-prolyl cis-trans isomerase, partial [Bacillariaceae sp.]
MNFGDGEQAVTATADLESETTIEVSRLPSSSPMLKTDICFDEEELEDAIFPFDEPDINIISSINNSSISSESTSERRSPNDDDNADAATETAIEKIYEKNAKHILEICYGNAVAENEEKGEKEDSTKREKKKKTSKKRRKKKKNDKIKKEKSIVQMKSIRDATGKIVRKRRKIKDRH